MAESIPFVIKVPCSSANLGPGFDVIGLALDVYLALHVSYDTESSSSLVPSNFHISSCEGDGAEDISQDPQKNLITRVAATVLHAHDLESASVVKIRLINSIPLSRGLGSSAAAVVAGVFLANQVGKLNLSRNRMLDYCLQHEHHPDNVAPAIFGGLVATYLKEQKAKDATRGYEVPQAEVLPQQADGIDTGSKPTKPPHNIGNPKKFPWASEIRCITVIPDFVVPTVKAREALPKLRENDDAIFNMQRIARLPSELGQSPPDAQAIFDCMQDRFHQPQRGKLVPGLAEILKSMKPESHPGLLGVCLSGAGPTILALATGNVDQIAETIWTKFKNEGIESQIKILRPAENGTEVISMG